MDRSNGICAILVVVTSVITITFLAAHRLKQRTGSGETARATSNFPAKPASEGTNSQTGNETVRRIQTVADSLRVGRGSDTARTLADLKDHLSALPRETAATAIRAYLESSADAKTGLGFKIAADGSLSEAPTLRLFLLEYLGQLDPAAAADYARTILNRMDSADEWAIAFRAVARERRAEDSAPYLEAKMRALLTHEPWVRQASTGFLEAFDVAVYLRGTNLLPQLTALVRRTDISAVSHAAYLALDRLSIADAAPILAKLSEEPDLMQGREVTRANYFARADVRDATQRQILEGYLLDPRRAPEELQTFAGLYPNANYMISQNLLTPVNTPTHAELLARDQATLRVVNEWLADARFAALRPQLEKIRARLENFVQQGSSTK